VGTGWVRKANEFRGSWHNILEPLPKGRGFLPLGAPRQDLGNWRLLQVRVEDEKVRVSVDYVPLDFDVPWVVANTKLLRNAPLAPQGKLGIWVCNGEGSFRNASIMALPETEKK